MKKIVFLLITLSSCSNYFHFLDKSESFKVLKKQEDNYICPINKKVQTPSKNKGSSVIFNNFLKRIDSRKLPIEKVAILSALFQLNLRPDIATPSSRLQIYIKKNNELKSFDIYIKDNKENFSIFSGLKRIHSSYNHTASLKKYIKELDTLLPNFMPIERNFSKFLKLNKKSIKQIPSFRHRFFKAGTPLEYGESISKIDFSDAYNQVNNSPFPNNQSIHGIEFPFGDKVTCNIDLNLYKHSIFTPEPENYKKVLPFGHQEKNGDFFLGIYSSTKVPVSRKGKSQFFKTNAPEKPIPICYQKRNNKLSLFLASLEGREPAQHLFHLIQYDALSSNNTKELFEYIKFARHQFLPNPSRMFYESRRGTQEQLTNFLQMEFPIYHSTDLGEVWSWIDKSPKGPSGFVLDPRKENSLLCKNSN